MQFSKVKEPYIKITKESFFESVQKDGSSFLHSFEEFLDKSGGKYEVDLPKEALLVEVKDEVDAYVYGQRNNLKMVEYHNEGAIKKLLIVAPLKRRSPKAAVHIDLTGKEQTISKYLNYSLKELQKTHLTKAQIVSLKILSKAMLDKYLAEGKLQSVNHGSKTFISREELHKLM